MAKRKKGGGVKAVRDRLTLRLNPEQAKMAAALLTTLHDALPDHSDNQLLVACLRHVLDCLSSSSLSPSEILTRK